LSRPPFLDRGHRHGPKAPCHSSCRGPYRPSRRRGLRAGHAPARRLASKTQANSRTAPCIGSTCRSTGRWWGRPRMPMARLSRTGAPGRQQFRLQPQPAGLCAERSAATQHRRRGAEHAALRDQFDRGHWRPSRPGHRHGPPAAETDFGETMHVYGLGEGDYHVLPVFGPSTTRDSVGLIVDFAMNPLRHVVDPPEIYYLTGARAYWAVRQRGTISRARSTMFSTVRGQLHRAAVALPAEPPVRAAWWQRRLFDPYSDETPASDPASDAYFDPYSDPYFDPYSQ
jgi:hypothetical protein